jgi:hypothetical protein
MDSRQGSRSKEVNGGDADLPLRRSLLIYANIAGLRKLKGRADFVCAPPLCFPGKSDPEAAHAHACSPPSENSRVAFIFYEVYL